MAMNKKELAEFAAMKKNLAVASAFIRTSQVPKDLPPPDAAMGRTHTHGYDFNTYTQEVREYWSGACTHYTENPEGKKGCVSGSQRAISLYSSKLLALKALRHEVENEAAKDLADIDMQIEAEIKAQEGTK